MPIYEICSDPNSKVRNLLKFLVREGIPFGFGAGVGIAVDAVTNAEDITDKELEFGPKVWVSTLVTSAAALGMYWFIDLFFERCLRWRSNNRSLHDPLLDATSEQPEAEVMNEGLKSQPKTNRTINVIKCVAPYAVGMATGVIVDTGFAYTGADHKLGDNATWMSTTINSAATLTARSLTSWLIGKSACHNRIKGTPESDTTEPTQASNSHNLL